MGPHCPNAAVCTFERDGPCHWLLSITWPCPEHLGSPSVRSSCPFAGSNTMAPSTEASFHNFSFDTASRTGQALGSSSQSPVSSSDLNLLAQQFGQQNLNSDPRTSRSYNYPSYSLQQQQQQQQQQQDYSSSSSQSAQSYQQDYQSYWNAQSTRSQRQAVNRLQYDPSRSIEVTSLADRMIASDDQYTTYAPQSQRTYTYPEARQEYTEDEFTDEGIDMTSTNLDENHSYGLAYRRSMDFSTTDSRIQRPIRVRRSRRRGRD